MGVTVRSPKNLFAGLLFLGIGVAAAAISTSYRMGTALHMGPGYFPFALGVLLAGVGVAAVVQGLCVTGPRLGTLAIRPAAIITASVLVFALVVERFGLVPACLASVLLASFAHRDIRPAHTVALAVVLTVAAVVIFIYGLKLPLTAFG